MIVCIFFQVNNLILHQSYLKSPLPVIKKCKKSFFVIEKMQNTGSAQLCTVQQVDKPL